MDPQIKKKKWDWEKFCTYQGPEEEQEKRARASPKLKSKQKFRKFCFWVLDIEENKEGLDSAIRRAIVESVWERSVWFDFLFDFLMKHVRVTEKLEVSYGA